MAGFSLEKDKRIRGRKLQAMRRRLLTRQPLCVMCQARGRISAAVHRDHIVALANGGEDTEANTQGLCEECHREKTAADLGTVYRPATPVGGW